MSVPQRRHTTVADTVNNFGRAVNFNSGTIHPGAKINQRASRGASRSLSADQSMPRGHAFYPTYTRARVVNNLPDMDNICTGEVFGNIEQESNEGSAYSSRNYANNAQGAFHPQGGGGQEPHPPYPPSNYGPAYPGHFGGYPPVNPGYQWFTPYTGPPPRFDPNYPPMQGGSHALNSYHPGGHGYVLLNPQFAEGFMHPFDPQVRNDFPALPPPAIASSTSKCNGEAGEAMRAITNPTPSLCALHPQF